jgi:hypothetical protein
MAGVGLLTTPIKWSELITFRKYKERVYLNSCQGKAGVMLQTSLPSPDLCAFIAPQGIATPFKGSKSTKRGLEIEIPAGLVRSQLQKLDTFILQEATKGKWFGYNESELSKSYHPLMKTPVDGQGVSTLRLKVLETTNVYIQNRFDLDEKKVIVTEGKPADIMPFVGVVPVFRLSSPWCFPQRDDKPPLFGISLDVTELYVIRTENSASGIDAFSL